MGDTISGATNPDSEISQEGGAFGDVTAEVSEIGSTGIYTLALSQGDMNKDYNFIKVTCDENETVGARIPMISIATYVPTEDITLAELAQGQPSATPTLRNALMLLFMAMRNDLVESSSLMEIYNDAGTVITKAAMSDAAGDFTKAKLVTGP